MFDFANQKYRVKCKVGILRVEKLFKTLDQALKYRETNVFNSLPISKFSQKYIMQQTIEFPEKALLYLKNTL